MKDFKKGSASAYRRRDGFTLIELLVVVAIIGILASVVLVALDSARGKGGDAGVKANLNTIRGESELFASNNGNSFGALLTNSSPCPGYILNSPIMLRGDKAIADAIAEATNRGGGTSVCYSSSNTWAVAVKLKSSDGSTNAAGTTGLLPDSWCVDSSGASKSYAWTSGQSINNSINSTTFLCN